MLHDELPVHATSHAHDAPQVTPPPHELDAEHVTSHGPAPQLIGPPQLLDAPHATVHEVAAPHWTPAAQAEGPLHETWHAIPAGHRIAAEQLLGEPHEKLHVVASEHLPPALVHASGHVLASPGTRSTTQYPPLQVRPAAQSAGTSHANSVVRRSTRQPAASCAASATVTRFPTCATSVQRIRDAGTTPVKSDAHAPAASGAPAIGRRMDCAFAPRGPGPPTSNSSSRHHLPAVRDLLGTEA